MNWNLSGNQKMSDKIDINMVIAVGHPSVHAIKFN